MVVEQFLTWTDMCEIRFNAVVSDHLTVEDPQMKILDAVQRFGDKVNKREIERQAPFLLVFKQS